MGRRIKRAQIKTISLVPRGYNNLPVLYKGDSQQIIFSPLSKMSDQGELTALVYIPETRDAEGDIASREVIKEMAHSFLLDGQGVDILHDNKPIPKDRAYVAESFIVQKGDQRFEGFKDLHGNLVNPEGGWGVLINIKDPELRSLYKSGAWNGVSLSGPAALEIEKGLSESDVSRLAERLAANLRTQPEEIDMNEDQMKKLLEAQAATLTKGLTEALTAALSQKPSDKPEEKKEEVATLKAPIFKGDATDPKALKAHADALRRYKLAQAVNLNDEKEIENLISSLEKGTENKEDKGASGDGESDEIKALRAKIAKLQKGTSQAEGGDKGDAVETEVETLRKGGLSIAAIANKRRGIKTA